MVLVNEIEKIGVVKILRFINGLGGKIENHIESIKLMNEKIRIGSIEEIGNIINKMLNLEYLRLDDGNIVITEAGKKVIEDGYKVEENLLTIDEILSLYETKNNKKANYEMIKYIMVRNIFKTLDDTEDIYIYDENEGIYKQVAESVIKRICQRKLNEYATIHNINEIVEGVKRSTYISRSEFTKNDNLVALKNGILDLSTMQVIDFSPDFIFTSKMNVEYNPDAECPNFLEFLKQKVGEDKYGTQEEYINTLQEFLGYILLPDNRFQKALLIYGERRTGKSTFLSVVESILGKGNFTSMTLQKITNDPYADAYLFGKMANISAELPSRALSNTGKFMAITGGDDITSAKKFGHQFSYKPRVKFLFSCNHIPATYNKDLAFYRRWLIVPFPYTTAQEDIDPNFIDKLTTEEEKSGIFNWMIEGLRRLLENKRFSLNMTDEEIKAVYEKQSDSVSSFVLENIDTENNFGRLRKRDVYKEYCEYCRRNKLIQESFVGFGRKFKEITGCGDCRIDTIPAYSGVEWKRGQEVQEKIGDTY